MTDVLDRTDPSPDTTGRSRRVVVVVGLLLVAALAGAVWWFFLRDDAPDAFDIDDAVADVEAGDETDTPDPTTDAPAAFDGVVDGTWSVAADSGSEAGFRVAEELASIGATEAVGRTTGVTGTLTIDGTTIDDVAITVDMTSLATDDPRRDGRMRSALGVSEFPEATFVLTEPIVLDAVPAPGETVSVTAVGEMTIHGVTNPVEVPIDAQVTDEGVLVVVGALDVVFADYDVETPTAAIVVSLEDQGVVEFQLFLTR